MIVIQNSVWRADCIACIHMDEEDEGEELHVLPVGLGYEDTIDYEYESRKELIADFKKIVAQWEAELRAGSAK